MDKKQIIKLNDTKNIRQKEQKLLRISWHKPLWFHMIYESSEVMPAWQKGSHGNSNLKYMYFCFSFLRCVFRLFVFIKMFVCITFNSSSSWEPSIGAMMKLQNSRNTLELEQRPQSTCAQNAGQNKTDNSWHKLEWLLHCNATNILTKKDRKYNWESSTEKTQVKWISHVYL